MQYHRLWSKSQLCTLIIIICLLSITNVVANNFTDSDIKHISYPNWFKEGFVHLDDYVKEAHSSGKKGLMILFTNEGCSYCSAFIKNSLGNPEIASRVIKNFDSVGLEIFDDNELISPNGKSMRIKHFAKQEKAEFSPTLLFYDNNGKKILRLIGYQSPERFSHILDYVLKDHYRKVSLGEYFSQLAPKQKHGDKSSLRHDPIFSDARIVLKNNPPKLDNPLLVIFEKPNCTECDNFHRDVLKDQKIRNKLKKFKVVQIDATANNHALNTPGGHRLTPNQWYKQLDFARVPALLFINKQGRQVLKTDALILQQRMTNSLNYVLEHAYEKDWTYQRFARTKAIERSLMKQKR